MTLRPPEAFRFSVHNQISLVSLEWDCCLRFIIDSISVIAQVVAERPSLGVFVVPRLLPRNVFTVSVASVKEASRSPMNSPLITWFACWNWFESVFLALEGCKCTTCSLQNRECPSRFMSFLMVILSSQSWFSEAEPWPLYLVSWFWLFFGHVVRRKKMWFRILVFLLEWIQVIHLVAAPCWPFLQETCDSTRGGQWQQVWKTGFAEIVVLASFGWCDCCACWQVMSIVCT